MAQRTQRRPQRKGWSPEARFFADIEFRGNDCWNWIGPKTQNGYGTFTVVHGQPKIAHRYAYELLVGPIPEGLESDHLCRNRACVNPAHLEMVTHAENIRRAEMASGVDTANGRKTHCPQGHPYSGSNLYEACGRRYCRACQHEHKRRAALAKAA